jgi:transmembrane sensor
MAEPSDDNEQVWGEAFDWLVQIESAPDDGATKAAFQAWLECRPSHAMAYVQVRKVWDAAPALPPAFPDRWEPRRRVAPTSARPRSVVRRRWLIGAAAASLAVALAAGNWSDLWADYGTGTGEAKIVTLADGSQLQLDTNSAVRVSFDERGRSVELLRGRAFFEVAPDTNRPFAVTAGGARAVALGTRFEMRRDESRVSVQVEEGRVAVSMNGRNALQRPALERGQGLAIDLASAALHESSAAPEAIGAWRQGRLLVEGWTVAEVVAELGRYHRGAILLRDDALGARLVSGVYDLDRPIDAVRAVAEAHEGQVTAIGPWLVLVSGR